MAEAPYHEEQASTPAQENEFCFLFTNECRQAALTQPLAEQAPSSPSVTGCKLGSFYLFFWHYLEERAPQPGEITEAICPINSLKNEESEALTSVRFAAQDHRAAEI